MSGNIFVISDLHLCHENIAKHRCFNSSSEHDEFIIANWNSVVNKGDTVYILGDITMEKSFHYHMLDRLKGYKKVILGNHDQPQHVPELLKYVNSVAGCYELKGCILTHMPIHESEIQYYTYNIHGHIHEKNILTPDNDLHPKYVNVCCEQINYTPKLLSKILNK